MSPGYRPVQIQPSTPGRPVQQTTNSGYQVAQSNSASPPPVESPVSPTGNRATSPPAGTHKSKRLYPKQINEAYTETNAYDQYQTFTPAATSGIAGQQPSQQPLHSSTIQHQQPQYFTPAGDQNYSSMAPPVPALYNQQYTQPQQQPSMAALTNQFSNMGVGGPSQVHFIFATCQLSSSFNVSSLLKRHI